MVDKKDETESTRTITFQPEDDVRDMLAEYLATCGKIRGLRSFVINSALRHELPKMLVLGPAALRKSATDKKPSK